MPLHFSYQSVCRAALMGIALLFCSSAFAAISAKVETELNARPIQLEGRPGQAAIADGVMYIGTASGNLHAVDMRTGRELWRATADGPVFHAPYVGDSLVLYGSQDGRLRAVDKKSGAQRWVFAAGDVDWDVRDIFINGTPNVVDGIAYFSSEDFRVYAVELATGRAVWQLKLGEEPQAWTIPIMDGVGYIGTWDGHMYAFDIDTGQLMWRSSTDDKNRAALPNQVPHVTVVPALSEDAVYFSDWAGNLFAVDRKTGEQLWRFDPGAADSRHVGSRNFIALVDDVVYYSTAEDQHLYGVDRHTGEAVWSTATDGILYGPMRASDGIGLLFEILNDGASFQLHAFDFRAKAITWSADDVAGPPATVDGTVYYGTTDSTVVGRDLQSGKRVYPATN